MDNQSSIVMYQTEDGVTKIDVRFENETVWLTQAQMAELFNRDRSVITKHILNIFEEGELDKNAVCANFARTASDGKTYQVDCYNLDIIISVGYRVKSLRGTQFRIWANSVLKEYMLKGFAMNDDLLKKAGGGNYFDELLSRIRDIRSSEKVFYRKVLEIYATSADYDKKAQTSVNFFKTVQNKMHWAAHGHTAAELIAERANASLPLMGMTSLKGISPTLAEAKIAKNYLNEKELDTLNRLVTMYLDFAEFQAQNHKVMYMKDWIVKLDDFLKMTDRNILTTAGKVSHQAAAIKAEQEYDIYSQQHTEELSKAEKDFIETLSATEKKLLKHRKD